MMQKTSIFLAISSILVSAFIIMTPFVANAQPAAGDEPTKCRKTFLGIPSWYKYLPLDSDCNIDKNSPKIANAEGRIVIFVMLAIFEAVLYIAGLVAVIFVAYGGFKFLTSLGEPQKIAAARTTILNALVGLAIAILASRVVAFIGGSFF